MGLFNRKPKDDLAELNQIAEEQPSLAEKIGDNEVEKGLPQDLSSKKKNSIGKVMFLAVALVAVGVIVAGAIGFTGGSSAPEEKQPDQLNASIQNSQPKNFEQDKLKLAMQDEEQAQLEAELFSTEQAETDQPEHVVGAPEQGDVVYQSAPASSGSNEPEQTPKDRKLQGGVLVSLGNVAEAYTGDGEQVDPNFQQTSQGGNSPLQDRLKPTVTMSTNAMKRGDMTYVMRKGTNIACTLETQIITTHPGLTRCLVNKDVYSANGKVLLLERGSSINGEQTSALVQGQARVFVLWNEVETPNGVRVAINSPGAGQLGAAGHSARVNNHFWQRFGGAILISLIGDVADNINNRQRNGGEITFSNSTDAAQDMATEALKNSINIPPTGYVNHGSLINVMVARDVDFSSVYERVTPY